MPENIRIKSDEIKKAARGQAVVEAVKQVEGECKLLSVTATPFVRVGEVFTGEARYNGKVRFDWIIVRDGKIECESALAEFSDKITSPELVTGMSVTLAPEVINCECSLDGGSLKAVAVVDCAMFLAARGDCECLVTPDADIYCEKKSVKLCSLVAEASDIVYISDTLADVKATEALCAVSRVVITESAAADGEMRAAGAVYTLVSVRTEDGLIAAYRMVTPFVKSLPSPDVTEECIALIRAEVSESTATYIDSPDGNSIEIAVTIRLDATAVKPAEVELVTDVFCAHSELQTVTENIALSVIDAPVTVIDCVDGQIQLEQDRLPADNVLCVHGASCLVSGAKSEDGRVIVDGIVTGDIIYYSAEKNAVDKQAFELPFSVPLDVSGGETADVTATVTDVTVRVRRGSVFDVKAEIAFTVRLSSSSSIACVKLVKQGAAIQRPSATVIVHIARPGETLWQAAKALCCSPDDVEAQNAYPAPYAGGERLIHFCKRMQPA